MQEFRVETIGPSRDCAVLRVTGEVDVYTAPVLRERIQDLTAKDVVHIIADLSRVDFSTRPVSESWSAASSESASTADRSRR